MKTIHLLFTALLITVAFNEGDCQETVFSLLKNDMMLADKYFEENNFPGALTLYLNLAKRSHPAKDIHLRIARCYYFLKQYDAAVTAYEKHSKKGSTLPLTDIYYCAEALSALENYKKAVEYYKQYSSQAPEDELITKKIWRINNLQFLFEDSLHYAVRPIELNTRYGELCAVPFGKGLVFMSNRKGVQLVDKVDAGRNAPFYHIYYSQIIPDTITNSGTFQYGKTTPFNIELNSRFHEGPASFYDNEKKMVFASTSGEAGPHGKRTMSLYFAEQNRGSWKITDPFPYNSTDYSISDPAITQDGQMLYFSSDMKGGLGGKDLYRSEFKNGKWSKPKNLGEPVNTSRDEIFPYIHSNKILYFSSNGHAGLGGLDIFKAEINGEGFSEPQNAGYPLNTNFDEFGLVIDSINTHGYFSSNRKQGGYDDDIYEFDIDLQTYPLVISGLIKYKEHSWSDSSELKILPNAKLTLIDNIRNITVYVNSSDASGNFSIVIPYFSKYKVKVISEDADENIVSLEIPKHRKSDTNHEIVVVKDAFKPEVNPEVK